MRSEVLVWFVLLTPSACASACASGSATGRAADGSQPVEPADAAAPSSDETLATIRDGAPESTSAAVADVRPSSDVAPAPRDGPRDLAAAERWPMTPFVMD